MGWENSSGSCVGDGLDEGEGPGERRRLTN